jgi:hypothetical protein
MGDGEQGSVPVGIKVDLLIFDVIKLFFKALSIFNITKAYF